MHAFLQNRADRSGVPQAGGARASTHPDAMQLYWCKSRPRPVRLAKEALLETGKATQACCQQGDGVSAGDLAHIQPGRRAGRAGMPRSALRCADKLSCPWLSRMWTSAPSGSISILHVEQDRGLWKKGFLHVHLRCRQGRQLQTAWTYHSPSSSCGWVLAGSEGKIQVSSPLM